MGISKFIQSNGYAVNERSIDDTFNFMFGQETEESKQLNDAIVEYNNNVADTRCAVLDWSCEAVYAQYGYMSNEAKACRWHKAQTERNPIDNMTPEQIDDMMAWAD